MQAFVVWLVMMVVALVFSFFSYHMGVERGLANAEIEKDAKLVECREITVRAMGLWDRCVVEWESCQFHRGCEGGGER